MAIFQKKIDWRSSEGHQRLLINFLFPNSIENMPKWVQWSELLGESVQAAAERLKRDGALQVVNDAVARIVYNRGTNDLKELCRQNGLKVSGSKSQLAERLLSIDPNGMSIGFTGELLKCSSEGEQIANARKAAWEATQIDDRDLRGMFDRKDFDAEKAKLTQQFRQKGYSDPSDDDVKWSLLNGAVLRYATEGNMGLCRNAYSTQASFLHRRNKLQQSLCLYLIVCAYDLNGSENRGGMSPTLLKEYPLFDLKSAFLAPAIVGSINEIAAKLNYRLDQVKGVYYKATSDLGLPLSVDKTWSVLIKALEGKIDLTDQPDCFHTIVALLRG